MSSLRAFAFALVAAAHAVGAQATPVDATAALRTAADSFLALSRGGAPRNIWPDLSDATRTLGAARIDAIAAALRAVPRQSLSSPADQLLFDNLGEATSSSIASRVCRSYLWAATNPFNGWHVTASNAARVIAVGSDAARMRALEVFGRAPTAIDAERAMLQRGLDSGYTASKAVIAAVVQQLSDLLPADVTKSPLFAPALRDSSPEFRQRWLALIADTVYPAGRTYRAFLEKEYAPRARDEGSLSKLPSGTPCYMASLRAQTSVPSDAQTLMRDARVDVDRIGRRIAPLVRTLTRDTSLSRGIIALRTDPRFTFPSRDSILAAYQAATRRAAALFTRAVAGYAAESLVVTPYPDFQERAGLPPQYLRATADGSRPAQFMVNLSRTERMSVANAVSHEGYPGHHLAAIAALRAPVTHDVMRAMFFGGFTEGWGIYSEDLAEEIGLYESDLDRVGAGVHLLDVAVAAYLDVGMHTLGWNRQDLVDSMIVLGGRPRVMAENYADRHAGTPGQLATYYIGYRAIKSARESAQRTLGARFLAPEFHHEVLSDGSITLASMQAKLDRWVAAQATDVAQQSPVLTTTGAFFALSVADMAASVQWYREKLGLSITMEAPKTSGGQATVLEGGGLMVELVAQDEAMPLSRVAPTVRGSLYVHGIFKVGVVVDDYEKTLAALRARDVPIAIGPFPARNGQRANFIVRDNAGNYIQFFGRK